jgi:hypothetical protein
VYQEHLRFCPWMYDLILICVEKFEDRYTAKYLLLGHTMFHIINAYTGAPCSPACRPPPVISSRPRAARYCLW